ncbi:MAG: helix-turn-helix domain-containing protein, partial [Candidatus Manganitrophaceae bacterium]
MKTALFPAKIPYGGMEVKGKLPGMGIPGNVSLIFLFKADTIRGSNFDRSKRKSEKIPFGAAMSSIDEISPLLSTLRPTAQSLLIQLLTHSVHDEVTVSQADLAAWSGIKSRNTIRSAIKELVDQGWVKKIGRA